MHNRYSRLNPEQPLLTTGLALSAFTDIVITAGLCYYLRTLNRGPPQSKKMMSIIVSFAENNGVLTWSLGLFLHKESLLTRIVISIVAIASLVCVRMSFVSLHHFCSSVRRQWLVMPANLVYLGLHFLIGKCECRVPRVGIALSRTLIGYSNSLLATCVCTGSMLSSRPK